MKWRIQFLSDISPISSAQQSHDHGQLFWTGQLSLRVNLSPKANMETVKKSEKCITISEMPFLLCHRLHASMSHRPSEFGSLEVQLLRLAWQGEGFRPACCCHVLAKWCWTRSVPSWSQSLLIFEVMGLNQVSCRGFPPHYRGSRS